MLEAVDDALFKIVNIPFEHTGNLIGALSEEFVDFRCPDGEIEGDALGTAFHCLCQNYRFVIHRSCQFMAALRDNARDVSALLVEAFCEDPRALIETFVDLVDCDLDALDDLLALDAGALFNGTEFQFDDFCRAACLLGETIRQSAAFCREEMGDLTEFHFDRGGEFVGFCIDPVCEFCAATLEQLAERIEIIR